MAREFSILKNMQIRAKVLGFLSLFTMFFMVSCASTPPVDAPYTTRIYEGTYDQLWVAALKALNDYEIKVSNKDAGRIQTDTINGPYNERFFTYPDPLHLPEKFRYQLKVSVALVSKDASKEKVRVRIIKELEKYQDFLAGWAESASDGLEEKVILYRIQHLLNLEKLLTSPS